MAGKNELLEEVEKWTKTYQFSFQFWGQCENNVYIRKNDVEVFCSGGNSTANNAIIEALEYVYRVNRVPKSERIC